MRKLIIVFLSLCLFFTHTVYAQDDITGTEDSVSVQEQLNNLLANLSSLQSTLKKERQKRPVARKIKLITNKIIRAVNSIPPDKCLKKLKTVMDDFYGLVSELGSGIACGPPIIPPFLPEGTGSLTGDCIPPPDEPFERLQIGGPFGGAFADVNPIYNEARDLFQIDSDASEISDVCEGEVE